MQTETVLLLSKAVRQSMSEHVRRCLPSEAVGFLAGHRNDSASVALPLTSLGGPRTFLVDPRAQFEAERFMRAMGLEVVAIYHSHPGGTATLSPLDRFFARPDVTHIVVAVNSLDADAEILRAYRCEEEKVMEVPILIVE